MRPLLLFALLLGGLAARPAAADTFTVHECRGAHGERLFGDRSACADRPQRVLALMLPPAPANPVSDDAADRSSKHTPRRARAAQQEPDSYRCNSGGRTWYQHTPCSATAAGGGKRTDKVTQTRVPRSQACREIARPAALLRNGSERDDRAGPYAKATGRDPCR